MLEAPVSATRIIFKILNDISHDQFRTSNLGQRKQFSLFETEFKTEHNTFARFTFKISEVGKKNDYRDIRKGLEFLENFQKGWYKSVNEKGKTIKSYGGLISNANISDGNISFLISSYWMEQLVLIEQYNVAYLNVAWEFTKSKQILFYLWLLEVPEKGTKVNFKAFQEVYGYSYEKPKAYAKNVLKTLKQKLDKFSNRSFNYSISGENINIIPYYTKDIELIVKEVTSKKQEVTRKLSYWKTRHSLEKQNIDVLKSLINIDYGNFLLFKNSYDNIKTIYSNKGNKITELKGDEFISLFQQEIINTYQDSAWGNISKNGYPVIN